MRWIISTYFVLFSFSVLHGQYTSIFGSESTAWSMILQGYCDGVTSTEVKVTADTTIDGKDYKRISRYELYSDRPGYLREDTAEGKVWFLTDELEEEILVVNMSLEVNDTFKIVDGEKDVYQVRVDTIFFVDERKHIRFGAHCRIFICGAEDQPALEFIEGSGANAGLFSNINGFHNDMDSYMLCHFKDDLKVYGNELYNDTCFVEAVGTENVFAEPRFKVYPNPGSEILCIEILDDQLHEFSLIVYNEKGAILIAKDHLLQKNCNIDVSSLRPGNYFIRLISQTVKVPASVLFIKK